MYWSLNPAIIDVILVLTLNSFHVLFVVAIAEFELVNTVWKMHYSGV